MVTVSTSTEPVRAYHHGDLRNTLIEEGIALVEANGLGALSLREIARRAGVSPTAVYRHFPDKKALLAALADAGFARLAEAQRVAAELVGGGRAAFSATGRAYVRFALAHPALFRLAFTHAETAQTSPSVEDEAAVMLNRNARALSGGDEAQARRLALQAWAVVHGLAMLMLDGRVPPDDALIDATIDSGSLFRGYGNSNEASP